MQNLERGVRKIASDIHKISTTVFDRDSRTITSVSAEGVTTTTVVDEQERPVSIATSGVLPIEFLRDPQGRLSEIKQGDRSTLFSYDASGFLGSITDSLNQTTTFINNADGEVIEQILPGNRRIFFDRDDNGNITAVTTPTNNEHLTIPNLLDLLVEFVAPEAVSGQGADATTFDYNLDKKLVSTERPDGKLIASNYDQFGRLASQTTPRGLVQFGYSSQTGQLNNSVSTDGVSLDLSFNGSLLTQSTWSGAVSGSVGRVYNNDFLVQTRSVNGGNIVTFSYDDDGNVIEAGGLSLFYNPNNGFLTSTTLGTLTESIGYNSFGEVSSLSTAGLFSESFTRDKLGRIATEAETIGGTTTNYEYFYDEVGQLDQVLRNGALVSDYDYDDNGNRTQSLQNGQAQSATYDNQDRLISFGDLTFTYNRNGDLLTKVNTSLNETTTYDYDVFGNLKEVNLPDGRQIEYLVDGSNRRVGKKINGVLQLGLVYKDQLNPVAELDGSGAVVSRFVYASKTNVPDYMIKGGVTYKIVSDFRGSVRLVVNSSTGQVVQRMDYDEWGVVQNDTNPGFQPFGFAGGIYDSDTGLMRFGVRDYTAEVGRWTAKDPILFLGRSMNLYGYVNNDPINLLDVSGFRVGDWWDLPANFDRARQIANEELAKRPSGHNNAEDAMRHAEWSRRMVEEINDFTAWVAGTGHELDGVFRGQPWGEAFMDLHNNAVGREAGRNRSPVNPNDLQNSPGDGGYGSCGSGY